MNLFQRFRMVLRFVQGEDILTVKDRADRDMYMFKKERKERIASDKTKNYRIL